MAGRSNPLASSRLRKLAQSSTAQAAEAQVEPDEHCELCNLPIPSDHRHVLQLSTREVMCACRACAVLFDRQGAGGGHYRTVPDRRLSLVDFAISDLVWEELRIPVEMAFFFHSTAEERVMAYYPSPMGPTESQLELGAWRELEEDNDVLRTMEPDVEALLVNRARGARSYWLVPIDHCYQLVAVIRTRWKGLSGGQAVWDEINRFFEELDRRSRRTTQATAAPSRAAGGS